MHRETLFDNIHRYLIFWKFGPLSFAVEGEGWAILMQYPIICDAFCGWPVMTHFIPLKTDTPKHLFFLLASIFSHFAAQNILQHQFFAFCWIFFIQMYTKREFLMLLASIFCVCQKIRKICEKLMPAKIDVLQYMLISKGVDYRIGILMYTRIQ